MLIVLVGGGVGSVCRYLVSLGSIRLFGGSFAWGTALVNLLGCLLIGFLVGLADRAMVSRAFRILLVSGFLGGFTTFSTFSLESILMIAQGSLRKGLLNMGVNVGGGLALSVLGLLVGGRL